MAFYKIDNGDSYLEDWRDFEIKNDLCGRSRQAVRLSAEEMLHDTDNVFHLFVFKENQGLMVGWTKRILAITKAPNKDKKESERVLNHPYQQTRSSFAKQLKLFDYVDR